MQRIISTLVDEADGMYAKQSVEDYASG
jgi:hypothetical protein